MSLTSRESLARRYNINDETLVAVITDVLSRLHEATYKRRSAGESLVDLRFQFGEEACWHLFGILMLAYENEIYTSDARSMLLTEMQHFDADMLRRFRPILEKWDIEAKQDADSNG